ncbi:hypothetical protein FGRMN_2053 [Fusarium graminum]|nr:hypothetical protein FGRMN_2053 [Fusarium graminum]
MLIEELNKLRDGIRSLDYNALRAAIRGESIPNDFAHDLVFKCVVAGIRYHNGSAQQLSRRRLHPSIERALNAFMSLEPKATMELWEDWFDKGRSEEFQDFFDEHMTEENECEWAEWYEFPKDVHDVAPYDHDIKRDEALECRGSQRAHPG